jgi:hypothetical protein
VQGAGEELLARAALAGDEHGRLVRRDTLQGFEEIEDRARAADDAQPLHLGGGLRRRRGHGAALAGALDVTAQPRDEAVDLDGLETKSAAPRFIASTAASTVA